MIECVLGEDNRLYVPKEVMKIDLKNKKKYFCLCCGEELIFRNGEIKRPHFSHKKQKNSDITCAERTDYKQTLIHCKAKEFYKTNIDLKGNGSVTIISNEHLFKDYIFNYDEVILEKNMENNFVPDVILINSKENKKIAIEIKVTHGIDDVKREKINKENLITIEIDLSKYNLFKKNEPLDEILLENILKEPIIVSQIDKRFFNEIKKMTEIAYWNKNKPEERIEKTKQSIEEQKNQYKDLFKDEIKNNENCLNFYEKEIDELNEILKQLNTKKENNLKNINFLKSIENCISKESYNNIEIEKISKNITENSIKISLDKYLENLKNKGEDYKKRKEQLETKQKDCSKRIEAIKKDIPTNINKYLDEKQEKLKSDKNLLESKKRIVKNLENSKSINQSKEERIRKYKEEINYLENKIKESEKVNENDEYKEQIILKEEINHLKNNLEKTTEQMKNLENPYLELINFIKRKIINLQEQVSKINKEIKDKQKLRKKFEEKKQLKKDFIKTVSKTEIQERNKIEECLNKKDLEKQQNIKIYDAQIDFINKVTDEGNHSELIKISKNYTANKIFIPNIDNLKNNIYKEFLVDFLKRKGIDNFYFSKLSFEKTLINIDFLNDNDFLYESSFDSFLLLKENNIFYFNDFFIKNNEFYRIYEEIYKEYENFLIDFIKRKSIVFQTENNVKNYMFIPFNESDISNRFDYSNYFKIMENIKNFLDKENYTKIDLEYFQFIICFLSLQKYYNFWKNFETEIHKFDNLYDFENFIKNILDTAKDRYEKIS